jgi:hypothetical protein
MVDEEPKLSYLTILSNLKRFTLPFFCSRIYYQQLEVLALAIGAFVNHQRFPTGRHVLSSEGGPCYSYSMISLKEMILHL